MKSYNISQIFGPTRQGEGPEVGMLCHFVRFAGCDWDCSWCDTKYAVNPKYPGWHVNYMTPDQILEKLLALHPGVKDLIMTGGNPALFLDGEFMSFFGKNGYNIHIETQAGHFKNPDVLSYHNTKCLVISPKPPSSGMAGKLNTDEIIATFTRCWVGARRALKYVAFSHEDLDWIVRVDNSMKDRNVERFVSVGTVQGIEDIDHHRRDMAARYQVVHEWINRTPGAQHFILLPQMHSMIWGPRTDV